MNNPNSITQLEFARAAARIARDNTAYRNQIDLAILTLWPKGATSMRLTEVCIRLELVGLWQMSRDLKWYFRGV